MTNLITAPVETPAVVDDAPKTDVLITEHEVAFGTAAATVARPAKTRTWIAALQAKFDERPKRRDYPSRLSYLEHSAMARAMERL